MTLNQERFTTYKSLSPVLRTRTTPGHCRLSQLQEGIIIRMNLWTSLWIVKFHEIYLCTKPKISSNVIFSKIPAGFYVKSAGACVFLIISRSPGSLFLIELIPRRCKTGFYMLSIIEELRPFPKVLSIWKGMK